MPSFGATSKERLATCHPLLIRLAQAVIRDFDFSVICGYRGKEDQDKAYFEGASNAKYGDSLHNVDPSLAIDVAPWPTLYKNRGKQKLLVQKFYYEAFKMKIPIRSGGLFSNLTDWDHIELVPSLIPALQKMEKPDE